jgi:hypothetical protein
MPSIPADFHAEAADPTRKQVGANGLTPNAIDALVCIAIRDGFDVVTTHEPFVATPQNLSAPTNLRYATLGAFLGRKIPQPQGRSTSAQNATRSSSIYSTTEIAR